MPACLLLPGRRSGSQLYSCNWDCCPSAFHPAHIPLLFRAHAAHLLCVPQPISPHKARSGQPFCGVSPAPRKKDGSHPDTAVWGWLGCCSSVKEGSSAARDCSAGPGYRQGRALPVSPRPGEERSCCARAIPHRRAPSAAAAAPGAAPAASASMGRQPGRAGASKQVLTWVSATQLRCCRVNLGPTALWEHPHRCPQRNSYCNFSRMGL